MDVVASKSEDRLAELLPEVEQEASGWMGVHINLTLLHEQLLGREGLSQQSLDKVLAVSRQMANHLLEWGLKECDGTLLIFEDSDLLCLLKKSGSHTDRVIARLQREFKASDLLHLLHVYDMQDRMSTIVALHAAKRETADAYRLKHHAVAMTDRIMQWNEPDVEVTRLIQKKRRLRGKSCILIIEDDVLTRGMLATLLKAQHEVVQAKDAREGVLLYIDNAPDMVFLDIHLPHMNGNEVLKRLKTLDPDAYVVMLSGDSVKDNITLAQRYGAAGFVRKPFSREKVLEYVGKCASIALDPQSRALGWKKLP